MRKGSRELVVRLAAILRAYQEATERTTALEDRLAASHAASMQQATAFATSVGQLQSAQSVTQLQPLGVGASGLSLGGAVSSASSIGLGSASGLGLGSTVGSVSALGLGHGSSLTSGSVTGLGRGASFSSGSASSIGQSQSLSTRLISGGSSRGYSLSRTQHFTPSSSKVKDVASILRSSRH